MNLKGLVILLETSLLLASCATTSQFQHAKAGQIIETDTYSVETPRGEDWYFQAEKGKKHVTFSKPKPNVWGLHGATMIFVDAGKAYKEFSSEEDAADYIRRVEENDLIERGVKRGEYSLQDIKKDSVTVGSRKLYSMSYKTISRTGEAIIDIYYLYFPLEFMEDHTYYDFGLSKGAYKSDDSGLTLTDSDLAQIYKVIDSLKIMGAVRKNNGSP